MGKYEGKQLYFIALTLPLEISAAITVFKLEMAERFNSKAALKLFPHITLKAPFHIPDDENGKLLEWFEQLNIGIAPFRIGLKDFGAFPKTKAPVIFVQPAENSFLLSLHRAIVSSFNAHFPMLANAPAEFHPHVTIGYRDLDPKMFDIAWTEYQNKNFSASFEADSFHLLHHDGTKWSIINTKYLAK